MSNENRPFQAGILDFNLKRMTEAEAVTHSIPKELLALLADWRQYPLNIAKHFPVGVSWFSAEQPWFYRSVLSDEQKLNRLKQSDVLIFSGSGMSAYKYQENDRKAFTAEERLYLEKAQEIIRDHLGKGKWVLGDCFGGQLAVHAVGGQIGRLPDNEHGNTITEAGWLEHELTDAGQKDAIMKNLPNKFSAPHFHSDFVLKLPEVGTKIQTSDGEIEVTKAQVLAVRYGYADRSGVKNKDTSYIQASVVEFSNGARLYQIQPHPEMATPQKANFLVRMNPWLAKEEEMGPEYYRKALEVPKIADFTVSETITNFIYEAKRHLEKARGVIFVEAMMALNPDRYLVE